MGGQKETPGQRLVAKVWYASARKRESVSVQSGLLQNVRGPLKNKGEIQKSSVPCPHLEAHAIINLEVQRPMSTSRGPCNHTISGQIQSGETVPLGKINHHSYLKICVALTASSTERSGDTFLTIRIRWLSRVCIVYQKDAYKQAVFLTTRTHCLHRRWCTILEGYIGLGYGLLL